MRSNTWLAERLQALHQHYFQDISIPNRLVVRFGRKSKQRLGSIIAHKKAGYTLPVTCISINALFRLEEVPEYVIEATLAHEFVHYLHGFHSPHAQRYRHPHQGGIVDKEIRKRGAGHLLEQQEQWLKTTYQQFLREHYDHF